MGELLELEVADDLIVKATDYARSYMAKYDGSHDFHHIERVVALAHHIQSHTPATSRPIVTLCALLHDVGDKKYLAPGEDGSRLVHNLLVSLGAPSVLASKVQTICLGVSYSSEVRDPARVADLIDAHPELAVVQDADRLDAIGAVGVARAFAFGGAKGRALGDSIDHFAEKLVRLEGMMKTAEGRRLARKRTERIELMQSWWQEETDGVEAL
ncbi:hydrolase [Drechmeria coniospora]|uniref:Hydrolase n=1 Tax=Drechmeria coniospora TaxID=98403 RepID=A0A151GTL5_DRECN|nr:hydrolase [Drechmeria coniospora]KYK60403.1 hydrolase [Drechmeria coniospora]ODA80344.1 hypothetical protein RJ55_03302 [Drechmeria coniospora]